MLKSHPSIKLYLAACLAATLGCQTTNGGESVLGEDVSSIESALEMENGNLDFSDDDFGAGVDALDAVDETEVDDPTEEEPEVEEMMNRPDALLFHTRIVWGQFPLNRDIEEPTNWTGQISLNRGAIIIRRTIAFDGVGDRLLPRENRSVVNFRSITGPHHDGLALTLVDPTPGADEPLTLSYNREDGTVFEVAVKDLVGEPQALSVDELGNKVIAVALAEGRELCAHGFMAGRWHRVAEGRGVLLGRIRGPRGTVLGHMRGIYGVREDGSRVFFGKYINLEGEFKGIFKGNYADGQFRGRWIVEGGDRGVLAGRYDETIPGPEVGGFFLGRWAEAACRPDAEESAGE